MAKNKSFYVCSECGYKSPKWLGKCPQCNEWGSFEEEIENVTVGAPVVATTASVKEISEKVFSFKEIKLSSDDRDISKIKVVLSKRLKDSFTEVYFDIMREYLKNKGKSIELEVGTSNDTQYEIILVK